MFPKTWAYLSCLLILCPFITEAASGEFFFKMLQFKVRFVTVQINPKPAVDYTTQI